jgi:pSer/pThr/pTyr-binding forkhead associated (FHA) protein
MKQELNLTRMSGTLDGQSLHLEEEVVTFGRQPDCTVVLADDPEMSRHHARMYWSEGGWWLEDMGSSNGTFVGEFGQSQRIAGAVRLAIGQIFRVGRSRFRLEAAVSQEAPCAAEMSASAPVS